MSLVITIIELIIVLSVVAIVHEFGHFLVAKAFKMTVNEFSIGFGKALWQKKYKGTTYSLRLVLLGGYVAIEGEDSETEDANSFAKKPCYQRILVLVAGVTFNFILAILILLGINFSTPTYTTKVQGLMPGNVLYEAGIRDNDIITKVGNVTTHIYQDFSLYSGKTSDVEVEYISNGEKKKTVLKNVLKEKGSAGIYFDSTKVISENELEPVIQMVEPGSSAEKAGFKSGDIIAKIDGVSVANTTEVINITASNYEKELKVVVLRNGEEKELSLTPEKVEYADLGVTSVSVTDTNLIYSWYKSANTVIRVVNSYADLFKGKVKLNQMSGIVGVGEMVSKTNGLLELLSLLATISLAIGTANILPFPPLDGGKIVLVGIEAITRKKVSQKVELTLSSIGLGLLLILTIYVTIKDIIRII